MTKQETIELQTQLAEAGYYTGNLDGIYGPKTAKAYQAFWATYSAERVPIVTPAPATPWYTSKGIWGALLVGLAIPMDVFFGIHYDPELVGNAISPFIEMLPDAIAAVGALMAYFGRKNAKAPIDPTLIAKVGGRPIRFGSSAKPLKPQNHFLDGAG